MPPNTRDLDDRSRVRLTIPQLALIIGAIFTGTSGICATLFSLREDLKVAQLETRNSMESMRAEASATLREWQSWRARVDDINRTQDQDLQKILRAGRE